MSRPALRSKGQLPLLIACLFVLICGLFVAADYPESYVKSGLPEYPGAKVIDTGRQIRSLRQGIRVQIETRDNTTRVARYFEQELKAAGWKMNPRKRRTGTACLLAASKERLQVTVLGLRHPHRPKTRVTIDLIEK